MNQRVWVYVDRHVSLKFPDPLHKQVKVLRHIGDGVKPEVLAEFHGNQLRLAEAMAKLANNEES